MAQVVPVEETVALPMGVPLAKTLTTSPAAKGALRKPETSRPAEPSLVAHSVLPEAAPLSLVMLLRVTTWVGATLSSLAQSP